MRHSLNSYEVYAMFLNDGILPELTYGTVHYNMPQHTLMCVAPGQIGGKTDTGEIVKAKGWALLFDSELLHRTFLGSQMSRYRFFSYNTSEPLLMTDDEWNTIVSCLEQLRAEISVKKDDQHQLPVIASWLSRTIEVQQDQQVVSTGLYGIVRHPMYAATLLLFLSMPLVLGSPWAFLVMLLYVPIIALRICNEEQVLERDLKGYKEYLQKVRYKVIPLVW